MTIECEETLNIVNFPIALLMLFITGFVVILGAHAACWAIDKITGGDANDNRK